MVFFLPSFFFVVVVRLFLWHFLNGLHWIKHPLGAISHGQGTVRSHVSGMAPGGPPLGSEKIPKKLGRHPQQITSRKHLSLLAWTLNIRSIVLEGFASWAAGARWKDMRVSFHGKALSFANFVTQALLCLCFLICTILTLLALRGHCEDERSG